MNKTLFGHMMALLSTHGITDDARHDLIFSWTNGRTSSSKDLNDTEIRDLCFKLEHQFDAPTVDMYLQLECKKLRSQVLKIATEVGIKDPDDFIRFNRFMKEHSILHKELKNYTLTELHELVKQFRSIERNYQHAAVTPGTKAWYHANRMTEPATN